MLGFVNPRTPMILEIVALALAIAADTVIVLVTPPAQPGVLAGLFTALTPAIGLGAAALAVLRRRFDRVKLLTAIVAGASLLVTALTVLADQLSESIRAQPPVTEVLALAILCGAACHRATARTIVPLILLSGVAMTTAPLLRFGPTTSWALLAVPAALLWGGSVGTGLVLRDATGRAEAAAETARSSERLALARELHDFVAHHVTGMTVLAQGARVAAGKDVDTEVYAEIEQAGLEALTEMRRVVGMLRTDPSTDHEDGVALVPRLVDARGVDSRIRIHSADLRLPKPVVDAAHRIVVEAVTNARRYAVPESAIVIEASVETRGVLRVLVVRVVNQLIADAVRGNGYGLTGMAERAERIGGTLTAGPADGDQWHVVASLPVG
jgi:signal transduction histidine kinase